MDISSQTVYKHSSASALMNPGPYQISTKIHAELKGITIKGCQKETCPTWAKVEENFCSVFSQSF